MSDTSETTATELFDLTLGMDFDVGVGDINDLAASLENAEAFPVEKADDETLAEYAAALKKLGDAAEDARKDVFEAELKDRVDDGETVGNLRKQTGKSTWVADTEGAFAAVADAGIDPMEVADVSISDLRDAIDDADEYIGESSYAYFRMTQ